MQKYKAQTLNQLNIISYNLKFNKATPELEKLAFDHNSDILCVQECYPKKMPKRIADLTLRDTTKSGHLGLAIYAREQRFDSVYSESCFLERGIYEKIFYKNLLAQERERLLIAELYDNRTNKRFNVACFHATHLVTTNGMRRKQIQGAYQQLERINANAPTIMVGDYNYPLFKKHLKYFIESNGYDMLLSDKPTFRNAVFKGHFDFVTSINARIDSVLTLPRGLSDHMPILVQAAI